jgi:7-cyano-7-deazaguanine synthase
MREKSVVLLSAGLDSSYNLFRAVQDTEVVLALTFNYGQRAAIPELRQARRLAETLKIPHRVVELPWFRDFTSTALLNEKAKLPQKDDLQIDSPEKSAASAKAVWVPNRNGIFLNIAAGFAEGLGAVYVIPGFNKEEAATFPDNSSAFMRALDRSFEFSTQGKVRVRCYSEEMNKNEIVASALKLSLPLELLWPCYESGANWCLKCESCLRFQRALGSAGVGINGLLAAQKGDAR